MFFLICLRYEVFFRDHQHFRTTYRYHSKDPPLCDVRLSLIYVPFSYLSLYIGTVSSALLLLSIGSAIFIIGTVRASRIIHKILVDTILRSTLRQVNGVSILLRGF